MGWIYIILGIGIAMAMIPFAFMAALASALIIRSLLEDWNNK